jgi:hypothetical protein
MCEVRNSSYEDLDMSEKNGEWVELDQLNLVEWDERLQRTNASLYQYPFWNEPFKRVHFQPRYLTYSTDDREIAFVCILTFSFMGFKIGLVRYGPVSLIEGNQTSKAAWKKLELWARENNYIFLRITNSDEQSLAIVKSMRMSKRIDAFPLYPEETEELMVPQSSEDSQMLSALSHEARRQIMRAREVGYTIEYSESAERFTSIWPLFKSMVSRKNINSRPFEYYHDLMSKGARIGCCRLYIAKFGGKDIQAILVSRAGKTAYLMAGALDTTNLPNTHSPSYLLHWYAMRDFFNLGTTNYHIGNRAGPVYRFKKKFNPTEIATAPPVTLITNRFLFFLWSITILKMGQSLQMWIRKLAQLRR